VAERLYYLGERLTRRYVRECSRVRLRGARGAVRPTRTIRSLAVVGGATIPSTPSLSRVGHKAAGAENRLFLVQFDAEELRRDVGLFLGERVHGCQGTRVSHFRQWRRRHDLGGTNHSFVRFADRTGLKREIPPFPASWSKVSMRRPDV
jgi:hypothetical protein